METINSEKQPLLGYTLEPNRKTQRSGNVPVYSRRKSSTAKLAVERLVRTRERVWATAISAFVAAIPTLLVGYTVGYPSSTIPDLQALPPGRQFSGLLSALFGVSEIAMKSYSCYQHARLICHANTVRMQNHKII